MMGRGGGFGGGKEWGKNRNALPSHEKMWRKHKCTLSYQMKNANLKRLLKDSVMLYI